jgi:S-DNA-T family DNA segregation ATPase FtsK/SpoIIIE
MTDEQDAESYDDGVVVYGEPVDAADEPRTAYATITSSGDAELRPIIAAWARNPAQRREMARTAAQVAAHHAAYHALYSWKYLGRVAMYAPLGVVRGLWKVIHWLWDLQGFGLRQAAATKGNAEEYLKLSAQRDRRVAARTRITLPLVLLVVVAVAVFVHLAPLWMRLVAAFAVALPLAWLGRPPGKQITERVTVGQPFTRLTAEMVRAALVALGIPKLREPGDVKFEQPGVHRVDGGWLAPVLLPAGMEAIKVIEARGGLSSALRLPMDQVWPEQGPEHHGQLHLWVAPRPVSKMPPPRWSLLNSGATTSFFAPMPVGHDERGRPITHTLFQRNTLIGGQPGSGKSFDGRSVVMGALLDPTVELWIAAFKPSEDHYDLKPYATRYLCGVDEVTLDEAESMVEAVLAEIQRRQATLGRLKRAGKIEEGRTTPDLARAGLGLHGLVVFLDEVHELFLHSKLAGESMARALKQGRSCGVHIILVTQVADKDSVPPVITRVVSSRWCLSVLDQVANDQIMGTGAYKRGQTGTQFRPGIDAGWGVTSGLQDGYNGAARGYYPTGRDLADLLARIARVRAGSVFTAPDTAPRGDTLADVRRVFYAGEVFVSWQQLAARLADTFPERYTGIGQDAVRALVRDADDDIQSLDGKDKGSRKTLKGLRLEHLVDALSRREIGW